MADIEETSRHDSDDQEPHFDVESDENPAWKCRHKSGSDVRNLVVCIDGIANQFGEKNTNVVELYLLIRKEVGSNQLTWYNSGIGTYARPSWKSLKYYRQFIDHKIDLAIAWNFERTVLAAYQWLSDNYQEGDRIFLFGFSRGASQVRVLSAMIHKVGLLHKDNEGQIPFAFELYADPQSGETRDAGNGITSESMAGRFKKTFSHAKADVHYVGVWDTVSSIGVTREKSMLPGTVDGMKHVCYFRHALALDERRVKFSPEYAFGGSATGPPPESNAIPADEMAQPTKTQQNSKIGGPPQTLEVWFAGTHSDIGGLNVENEPVNRSRPPLRWMVFESVAAGLRTKPFQRVLSSNKPIEIKESLTGVWWILEFLPLQRLTYTRRREGKKTTHKPHLGSPRKIHAGQKIHGSLMLTNKGKDEYTPRARPLDGDPLFWTNCRTKGLGDWKAVDLFEGTQDLAIRFLEKQDENVWELFRRTAMTVYGRQAVYEATLNALEILDTMPTVDLSTRIKFISNITDILSQTESQERPLRKVDFQDIKVVFAHIQQSNNDDYIAISDIFLRRFIESRPFVEATIGHQWPIPSVAVFPNGRQFVAGSLDCKIRTWDTSMGALNSEHSCTPTDVINVVVVSPNGRLILAGLESGTINIWDAETGITVGTPLEGHTESIRSLAVSPDGKLVASGSEDNTVRIWDVDRGIAVGEPLQGHESTLCAVGFSDDGKQIVSCSIDRIVRVWDVETRQSVAEPLNLGGNDEWIFPTAISPDGKLVAAGFSDETICIWDLGKKKMVEKPFRHHRSMIGAVAFSPDGGRIVSSSSDGTVLVWGVETQKPIHTFQHGVWVRSVVFFPDGERVAMGCDDGIIRIRDAESYGEVYDSDFAEPPSQ